MYCRLRLRKRDTLVCFVPQFLLDWQLLPFTLLFIVNQALQQNESVMFKIILNKE